MANAKKNVNKAMFKLSKRSIIFACIAGVLLLAIGGLWLRLYIAEKASLSELSELNIDMQTVYSKLVNANSNNISSSSYGNNCSESSVEVGRGRIVCWTGGAIVLKQDVGLVAASEAMDGSVAGNALDSGAEPIVSNSQYHTGVSINYASPYKDVTCDGSYGQNVSTGQWSYTVSCRKEVPNFLPGYTVEE